MKRYAIYPGTFDPVTLGHLDIIQRASELFDSIKVTIGINPAKTPLFSIDERVALLEGVLKDYENVTIDTYSGLVVEHARNSGAIAIIRGLRAVSDFEYEFQMALTNRKIAGDVNTVFLMPNEKYTYLNSTIVRSLAQFGGDVTDFVPPLVAEALRKKFSSGK